MSATHKPSGLWKHAVTRHVKHQPDGASATDARGLKVQKKKPSLPDGFLMDKDAMFANDA
jgi:hypothetical protein